MFLHSAASLGEGGNGGIAPWLGAVGENVGPKWECASQYRKPPALHAATDGMGQHKSAMQNGKATWWQGQKKNRPKVWTAAC